MSDINFEYRSTQRLKPYANNPRTHSKKQIAQLAKSIDRFGWTNPILVDENMGVLAGHGRLEAARLLGLTEVPVLQYSHMSEVEKRAYIIADNKLAENARWDTDLLAIELNALIELDDAFEVELTGFETGEIDILLSDHVHEPEDDVPEPDTDNPAVSRAGDLWIVGANRLYNGNSLDRSPWETLMDGEIGQMAFTDPPYNVKIAGNVCGLGKNNHREFAMASGEMSCAEFTRFLSDGFQRLQEHTCAGSIHFVCMDWRHMGEVLAAGEATYNELKNLCVWAKTNAGMGTFYRSQHELVFAFKSGDAPHINNFGLGAKGRHRSNLWTFAGANSFHKDRDDDLAVHPTVKPLAMVADAILDCSHRNGIILDGFAGAGTTLVAAARTGRRGYGIELDPHYVDVCIDRLQQETGQEAVLAELGETFEAVRARRLEEVPIKKPKYDVGYGKPPKANQFKPGHSGNPKGRPKGARGIKTDLREELNGKVTFTENGKTKTMRRQQLMIRQLGAMAMKGDMQAIKHMSGLAIALLGSEDEAPKDEVPLSEQDEAILAALLDRTSRGSEADG